MYFEFVYIGYSFKQCDIFLEETAQKLRDRKIDFKYDKRHFTIQCEKFRLVGVPIHTSTICNLGIENADYVVKESAYPNYKASPKEYLQIRDILTYISTRFQRNPKEKSEKELEELIDILIEGCGCDNKGRNEQWVARYQQEPLPIIDCNNCEHISITEAEQRKLGNRNPHICQCYMKRCKHNTMKRDAVFIYPCEECADDGYKNFSVTSREDAEEFRNTSKLKCGLPPITDETIAKIEQVFGFPLYDWQKEYLIGKITHRSGGRRNGNTFAYCLRLLLVDGEPICRKELYKYTDEFHGNHYTRWFAQYCAEIDDVLKSAGFKTRMVA